LTGQTEQEPTTTAAFIHLPFQVHSDHPDFLKIELQPPFRIIATAFTKPASNLVHLGCNGVGVARVIFIRSKVGLEREPVPAVDQHLTTFASNSHSSLQFIDRRR